MTLLLANNIASVALVMVCWWLAHQNAAGKEPFGQQIAAGYAMLALNVMFSMGLRNWPNYSGLVPYSVLFGKIVLTITLSFVAWRLTVIASGKDS